MNLPTKSEKTTEEIHESILVNQEEFINKEYEELEEISDDDLPF